MNTCKTCAFWTPDFHRSHGLCDFVDTQAATDPETGVEIVVTVDDDSGLYARLKTGPEFGCTHHATDLIDPA